MSIQNGNNTVSYTDFKLMPKIPITIINTLATDTSDDAENFWKVLSNTTTHPLDIDNLTLAEKVEMIWNPDRIVLNEDGTINTDKTYSSANIYLSPLTSDSLNSTNEHTQLRVYRYVTKPTDRMKSKILIAFRIMTADKSSLVLDEEELWVERTDLMERYLLSLLNGRGLVSSNGIMIGSSPLEFNTGQITASQSTQDINNSKSLYGRTFYLALDYSISSIGGVCGG